MSTKGIVRQDSFYRFGWMFLASVMLILATSLQGEITNAIAAIQNQPIIFTTRLSLFFGSVGAAVLGLLLKNARKFSTFLFLLGFAASLYLFFTYYGYPAIVVTEITNSGIYATISQYAAITPAMLGLLLVYVFPGLTLFLMLLSGSSHGMSKFCKFLITILVLIAVGIGAGAAATGLSAHTLYLVPLIAGPWFFVLARGTYGENYEKETLVPAVTQPSRSSRDDRDDRRYDDRDRRYDDRRDDRRYDDRDRRYDDRDRRYDDRRDDRYYDRDDRDRRYDDRDRRNDRDDRRLPAVVEKKDSSKKLKSDSEFTGSTFGLLGVNLITFLVSVITLGFAMPGMICFKERWYARHTIVDNHRVTFDGNGMQLFGKWIGWLIMTALTVGIFAFFIPIKMKKWVTSHTHLK